MPMFLRAAVAALTTAILTLPGCGSAAPAPTKPTPEPSPDLGGGDVSDVPLAEPLETGNDCVTAEAECEGGMCTAKLQNDCEVPVTCELNVLVMCRGGTDTGEARGKGRDTFPAGADGELQAAGDCEGRAGAGTIPENMSCR